MTFGTSGSFTNIQNASVTFGGAGTNQVLYTVPNNTIAYFNLFASKQSSNNSQVLPLLSSDAC